MSRPLLLDLFCGQGGAGAGYARAGFEVVGVDVVRQDRYPFPFIQHDAIELMDSWLAGENNYGFELSDFSGWTGSPPCQDHSETKLISGDHGTGWMLAATRERFGASGLPWVIENVDGSALPRQADLFGANGLELCGCMFPGLRGLLYENRLFETSFPVPQLPHVKHLWPQTKMGRPPKPGECMQVTGHFTDADEGRRRMSAEWMTRDGLAQAIPPAYAEYLGGFLMERVTARSAA